MIERASFVVCLDQPHPHTSQQLNSSSEDDYHRTILANNVLHGNGTHYNSANRWFDHAFQVIINDSVSAFKSTELTSSLWAIMNSCRSNLGWKSEGNGIVGSILG